MRRPLPLRLVIGLWLGLSVTVATILAQPTATNRSPSANPQADATARIVASAQAMLATLDDAGRAKVQFAFESPQKAKWSNLPTGVFNREGVRIGDLTPAQRTAATKLL